MGLQAILAGASIAKGLMDYAAARSAGRQARADAKANAEQLLETGEQNVALRMQAAGWNAGQLLEFGEYNAAAIEQARDVNVALMAAESLEGMRQHMLAERYTASTTRALAGSSGISVNEGTPMHYLNGMMDEMLASREYLAMRDKASILNYYQTESTRADLVRIESRMKADATMYNANIEAQITMNDLEMQAEQIKRSGQALASAARWQGYGALLGGGLDAAVAWHKYAPVVS